MTLTLVVVKPHFDKTIMLQKKFKAKFKERFSSKSFFHLTLLAF